MSHEVTDSYGIVYKFLLPLICLLSWDPLSSFFKRRLLKYDSQSDSILCISVYYSILNTYI